MAVIPFPAKQLISDNERHFDTWDGAAEQKPQAPVAIDAEIKRRAGLAVDDAFTRGVVQLMTDEEYFWRKVDENCFYGGSCIGDLHKTYIRVTALLELEEKRGAGGRWNYSISRELALRQLRTAVCLRMASDAAAQGAH